MGIAHPTKAIKKQIVSTVYGDEKYNFLCNKKTKLKAWVTWRFSIIPILFIDCVFL